MKMHCDFEQEQIFNVAQKYLNDVFEENVSILFSEKWFVEFKRDFNLKDGFLIMMVTMHSRGYKATNFDKSS